jgi:hypothetical protein
VGGIILHHENIICFPTSEEDLMVEALPYVVGQDASMVLLVMKGSQQYWQAPLEWMVVHLECVSLGSNFHPEYNRRGAVTCILLTSPFKLSYPYSLLSLGSGV